MRFFAYLVKTLVENIRDWKILVFVLLFAPCFVFGMFAAFGKGSHSYAIDVINRDTIGYTAHSEALLKMLREAKYPDGAYKYKLHYVPDAEEISKRLKNRSSDAGLIIPLGFSATLDNAARNADYTPLKLKLMGDPRNNRYPVASVYLFTDLDIYSRSVIHAEIPVDWEEELVDSGKALTDFDFYVPGLVVLALLNVIFTAGASLIKEVEKGTMQRLILSRLKSWEFIAAISVIQVIFCVAAMLLTLWSAMTCGFSFRGSYAVFLAIGLISGITVMGVSMISVSYIKSVFDLLTVGMLPYFAIMFFGGIFFPLPAVPLFTYGDSVFRVCDLIPLSMSVSALNKSLNYGWGFHELSFDLTAIAAVSLIYFSIGLWVFSRKHMRIRG